MMQGATSVDLEGVLSTDLGLVFKAHRLVYHSTLGLRVIKKCECRGRRAWIWKGCSRSWLPGLPLATSRSSTCCPCATGYTCVTRVTTCVTRLPTTVCNPSGDSCRVCHWRHPGLSPLSFSYGVAYHRPYGSYRPGSAIGDIQVQLLHRNVQRFRGGLVLKDQTFVSLNSRRESNKEEEKKISRFALRSKLGVQDIGCWVLAVFRQHMRWFGSPRCVSSSSSL